MTDILGSAAFWIVLGLAGLALVGLGVLEIRDARRAGQVYVRTRRGGLILTAIYVATAAVPLVTAILVASGMSEEVRGLLVTLVGGGAGWLATVLQQLDERDQDQLDLMQALRAEIVITLHALEKRDPAAFALRLDGLVEQALRNGQHYQAFLPIPGPQPVFAALSDRIERLPSEVVERLIRFYSLAAEVRSFAEDMRSDQFVALELARRRPAYQNYFEMLMTLHRFAARAVYAINLAMGLKDPETGLDPALLAVTQAAQQPDVNRPAADRSGPGSAPDVLVDTP